MIKILGLLVVFLSSTAVGIYTSNKVKNQLKQQQEVINFLVYIKNQIEFFNSPINDIYTSFDSKDNRVSSLAKNLCNKGWSLKNDDIAALSVTEKTKTYLVLFGEKLGKSNKTEQLSHCEYYLRIINDEYKLCEKNAPQKSKMSIVLGIYAGIMLIILFI